jgi:uncharacterized protein (TIGR03435 family)
MADRVVRKPDFTRKLFLSVAGGLTMAAVALFGLLDTAQSRAQSTPENKTQGIAGTWQGTLHAGRDSRIVVKISKVDDGGYNAVFYSIDRGGDGLAATKTTLEGTTVKMTIPIIGGTYEGKLNGDGQSITGTWTQGPPLPLNLTRATPETEWTIPPPLPKTPPMGANANPNFEVATIKPSAPNKPGKGFAFRGGHFVTFNTNMNDLVAFAYGLHSKQIIDGPAWLGTDLYDIEAKPDAEGQPSHKQMQIMVQKLLTDRFKLTFHHDKRELSVYVLSLASGGPKMTMTKSTADPNEPGAFLFRELGDLIVRNETMAVFATWMQTSVMDKPVVDQTGLTDRYDFQLKWTPDQSQFGQFRGSGAIVPPPTNDPNAPPGLYTAIQEQLGLKMGRGKVPDDVIIIDHVEKPSEN